MRALDPARFYVYDCNGNIVGNPAGYRTMRGAVQQQDRRGSPTYNAIWEAYANREDTNKNLICSIKLGELK